MADEQTFESLLRDYAAQGKTDQIISLALAMKDQRDRAERNLDALTHINRKLNEAFRNITEPATGKRVVESNAAGDCSTERSEARSAERMVRQAKPKAQPKSQPKPKDGPDVSDFSF